MLIMKSLWLFNIEMVVLIPCCMSFLQTDFLKLFAYLLTRSVVVYLFSRFMLQLIKVSKMRGLMKNQTPCISKLWISSANLRMVCITVNLIIKMVFIFIIVFI